MLTAIRWKRGFLMKSLQIIRQSETCVTQLGIHFLGWVVHQVAGATGKMLLCTNNGESIGIVSIGSPGLDLHQFRSRRGFRAVQRL